MSSTESSHYVSRTYLPGDGPALLIVLLLYCEYTITASLLYVAVLSIFVVGGSRDGSAETRLIDPAAMTQIAASRRLLDTSHSSSNGSRALTNQYE